MTIRLRADGIGGLILVVIGSFFIFWTFHRALPGDAAIVPRVAAGAIAVGGFAILIRDLAGRGRAEVGMSLSQVVAAVAVLAVLSFYSWLMLRLGLATSMFLVLLVSSLVLRARLGEDVPSWARPITLAVIAAGVAALSYALFILLLDMYLPRSLLF